MQSYRKYIPIGMIVVVVGLWSCKEGLDSLRTGIPTHTLRMQNLEWWQSIGAGVLGILFGLCVISVGIGWMKPCSGPPPPAK